MKGHPELDLKDLSIKVALSDLQPRIISNPIRQELPPGMHVHEGLGRLFHQEEGIAGEDEHDAKYHPEHS